MSVARIEPRYSAYGCSKGTADQYVLDYARGYSVNAAVFQVSRICGPHQYGTEDQGWVAHFLIQALQDMPVTIYGNGKQVRDLLYIDDRQENVEGAIACGLRGILFSSADQLREVLALHGWSG